MTGIDSSELEALPEAQGRITIGSQAQEWVLENKDHHHVYAEVKLSNKMSRLVPAGGLAILLSSHLSVSLSHSLYMYTLHIYIYIHTYIHIHI